MRNPGIGCIAALLLVAATAAAAQAPSTTPRQRTDPWHLAPASASTADYRVGIPVVVDAPKSPFKFRDPGEGSLLRQPPPRPMDQAAVMGTGRAWVDGRPPLDCAQTPMDAKCH